MKTLVLSSIVNALAWQSLELVVLDNTLLGLSDDAEMSVISSPPSCSVHKYEERRK